MNIEHEFHALKVDPATLSYSALVELDTKLSGLRLVAAGTLRQTIELYMVRVNSWLSQRAREREAEIRQTDDGDRVPQTIFVDGLSVRGK